MAAALGCRSFRAWSRLLGPTGCLLKTRRSIHLSPLSSAGCTVCQFQHHPASKFDYSSHNRRRYLHTSQARRGKVIPFVLADIGEGISEVTVKEWYVKVGDHVNQFDNIVEVQSDKSAATITSRYDGVIRKLYYEVDDLAKKDMPLVDIELDGSEGGEESTPSPVEPSLSDSSAKGDDQPGKVLATPAVRRIAREHKIDLTTIRATGNKGRVLKEDILRHMSLQKGDVVRPSAQSPAAPSAMLEDVMPPSRPDTTRATPMFVPPVAAPSVSRQDRVQPIRGFQKAMVKTMTAANSIPTFGYCDEIDMSTLVGLRKSLKGLFKERGVKLSFMPFFIKAASMSLVHYPILNAAPNADCTEMIYKGNHNIGFAMDTPNGLVVPNIKSVQDKTIYEIAMELHRLMELGSHGKLGGADLMDGTMSLSNIGVIGGTYARPVLLPPEVLIGALGKVQTLPRFDNDGDIIKASILNVSWSADHRVIDGATVARFSNLWKSFLENPHKMLIDMR